MYLKKIELKGFKSFPNKTSIEFKGGITSIVGPNGSGKSNISDAVRWVLGEQSMKSLRGEKLEDVIFGGTDNKKPMSYCEVAITIDNKDRIIDIDYSEVTVKRRAYKSGESQFYINNEKCRLKDIKELLLDTGIGKEGYSIIEQGKIDEILSLNSASRRKIFDEASKISKYRYKKEESEKKLSKTCENLERINDIFYEIEKQIGPLEKQMKKALKYKNMSERLRKLEVNSFIRQISSISEKLSNEIEREKAIEKAILDIEDKKSLESRGLEELRLSCLEISKLNKELQNEEYDTKECIERKKTETAILKEKKLNVFEAIDRNESEIKRLEEQVGEEKKDLEKIKEALKEFENLRAQLLGKKAGLESEIKNHEKIIEKVGFDIENIKDKAVDLADEKNKKMLKVSSIQASKDAICERKNSIEKEMEYAKAAQKSKTEEIIGIKSKIEYEINSMGKIEKEKSNIKSQKQKIQEDIEREAQNTNRINLEIKENASKLKIYESMEKQLDGFKKGVKKVLKSDIGGIVDVVANIIKVEKEYELAIEIALGAAIQNIITTDEYSAKKAIDYLKNNNWGRATFLPLNIFDKKVFKRQSIAEHDKMLGFASDIVKCDKRYDSIMQSLLGRVIIAQDMDYAIEIGRNTSHKYKIVTLDGQVLNPGGSLTGGSSRKGADGILSRSRIIEELSQKIRQLNKELEESMARFASLKGDMTKCEIEANEIENTQKHTEKQLMDLKNKKDRIEDGLLEVQQKISRLQKEKSGIDQNVESADGILGKLKEEMTHLENEIANSQSKIKELSIDAKASAEIQRKKEANLNEIVIEITKTDSQYANLLKEKKRIHSELKRNCDLLNLKQDESKCSNLRIGEMKEKIEAISKELESKQIELKSIEKQMKEFLSKTEKIESQIERTEKTIHLYENEYMSKREELLDVKSKIQNMDSKIERISEKMLDSYALSHEDAIAFRDDGLEIDEKEIRSIKKSIRELGNVNMDSIKEYEDVKERYDFYKDQKQDLENSVESLLEIIRNMESSMTSEFKEKFELINERFNKVFAELFGGGSAQLKLSEPDNVLQSDIEIIARPPGKKLKNISLMSGGEKSLTAIAVIFAILLTRPTPFCILDEIEAALDDSNIYRFGEFLKRLSDKTQFIAITHRMGTMEASDYIYGVTMEENGISKILTLKLEDVEKLESFAG